MLPGQSLETERMSETAEAAIIGVMRTAVACTL